MSSPGYSLIAWCAARQYTSQVPRQWHTENTNLNGLRQIANPKTLIVGPIPIFGSFGSGNLLVMKDIQRPSFWIPLHVAFCMPFPVGELCCRLCPGKWKWHMSLSSKQQVWTLKTRPLTRFWSWSTSSTSSELQLIGSWHNRGRSL